MDANVQNPRPNIVKSNFGFKFLVYKLNKDLLTKELLTYYIKAMWKNVFPNQNASKYAALYITMNYGEGVYKSLGKASKVNASDLDRYTQFLTSQLDFKDNRYKNIQMDSIYFGFKILTPRNLTDYKSIIHDSLLHSSSSFTPLLNGSGSLLAVKDSRPIEPWDRVAEKEGEKKEGKGKRGKEKEREGKRRKEKEREGRRRKGMKGNEGE